MLEHSGGECVVNAKLPNQFTLRREMKRNLFVRADSRGGASPPRGVK